MSGLFQLWRFSWRLIAATVIVIALAVAAIVAAGFLTFRKRVRS